MWSLSKKSKRFPSIGDHLRMTGNVNIFVYRSHGGGSLENTINVLASVRVSLWEPIINFKNKH